MTKFTDHPLRYSLTGELHARPFPALAAPAVAAYLAIMQPESGPDRAADLAHLGLLLDHYGAPRPQAGATHYFGAIGKYAVKWEQHTEFVTYTVFADGVGDRAFDPAEFDVFPAYWLAAAPGCRITSALLRIMERPEDDGAVASLLNDWFVPESLAVARVLDDAAVVAGDFRIDPAGHLRFAIFVGAQTGKRRVGRVIQRLCEVETYKSMSMLGFALVRHFAPQLDALDTQLSVLTHAMRGTDAPEDTLHALLDVSVSLEELSAKSAYRFAATGAYEALVAQRIAVLREERCMGRQGFGEFMMRRYEPAMRTVKSAEARLHAMSARAVRASELLRTRVDVERAAQNQAILASMDKRADLQLRLQHTVEGLSVVAISYYAVSLAGYVLYPLGDPLGLSKGTVTAVITLPVVGAVWWLLRRLRRRVG